MTYPPASHPTASLTASFQPSSRRQVKAGAIPALRPTNRQQVKTTIQIAEKDCLKEQDGATPPESWRAWKRFEAVCDELETEHGKDIVQSICEEISEQED